MKKLLYLMYLLALPVLAQQSTDWPIVQIEFSGKIDRADKSLDVSSFAIIQDSVLYMGTTENATYRATIPINLSRPFYVAYTGNNCLGSRILYDLSAMTQAEFKEENIDNRLILPHDLTLQAAKPENPIKSIDLVRYYWTEFKQLDVGHFDLQRVILDNYLNNTYETHDSYYANGKLHYRVPMQNGMIEGEVSLFAQSGKVVKKIEVHADELDGKYSVFNEEGKLVRESNYQKGQLIQK